ncbi:MAG: GtrA family protein [Sulfuricaulis sp.]
MLRSQKTDVIDNTLGRFLLVGAANTVLGLGVIVFFRLFTSDYLANLIGFVLVVPVSFFTHRNVSFRHTGRLVKTFLRYLPTVAFGYSVNLIVLTCGMAARLNPYAVQVAAITMYVAATYLISRYFVFRRSYERAHIRTQL